MYLIDTSAWIFSFQKNSGFSISKNFSIAEIFIALPIYQEILQGFRNDIDFQRAQKAFSAAQMIENPLSMEIFDESISLYRSLRKKGVTVRSSVDILLATCAIRHNLTIVHRDRDFEQIARYSLLQQRSIK